MRLVLDTNVVVAGLLWQGTPQRLLDIAIAGDVLLASSPVLLAELRHTLNYRKFNARIARSGASVETWVQHYQALVILVDPPAVPRIVPTDPDDDHVIACAIAARADAIVSGDRDLLDLGQHQGIAILTAAQALARIA